MEDIILLETMASRKDNDVFRLMFPMGEFDMVVFNEEEVWCEIYEIKHSDKVHLHQYRHLSDDDKCKQVEHRYGTIKGKNVIYRGKEDIVDGIKYINVENYLKQL